MGDLTKNFSRHELACPCCGDLLIAPRLLEALQELRDSVQAPVTILSGYRCKQHNEEVGGSKYSQHLSGRAADIVVQGLLIDDIEQAAEAIPDFANGGIGIYPFHVHVDVRKKKARW